MDVTKKEFHIGDVLSVTHGRLVSPRHIDGVYDILGFLTGETLWTHQLPRAAEAARPVLLERHPELQDIDLLDVTPDNHKERLSAIVQKHGEMVEIEPLPEGVYSARDPLEEATDYFEPDQIIPVVIK